MSFNIVPIDRLGPCGVPSPLKKSHKWGDDITKFIPEGAAIRESVEALADGDETCFESAGPRSQLFFDPAHVRAAMVTCGGLCPGLNNVIRSITLELHYNYGVKEVLGLRYGYRGLGPASTEPPIRLTPDVVDEIHEDGGTILGTSRGNPPVPDMVDTLVRGGFNMLFCVGGDGTQTGAKAIADEVARRRLPIAVVGVPKTIDNDIPWVNDSFGYGTAIEKARDVLNGAHCEARSAFNGVGLVKLMGRDAGFIACGATLASQEVNFLVIPELPLKLDGPRGFLSLLEARLGARHHALVVVAEGAGQDQIPEPESTAKDAGGHKKPKDIGPYLKGRIVDYAKERGFPVDVKYIDPSYYIRSAAANSLDCRLCDAFARNAVHAAMSGRTNMIVGLLNDAFIHVPIRMVTEGRKRVDLESELWRSVLSATGQPPKWE